MEYFIMPFALEVIKEFTKILYLEKKLKITGFVSNPKKIAWQFQE